MADRRPARQWIDRRVFISTHNIENQIDPKIVQKFSLLEILRFWLKKLSYPDKTNT